VAAVPVKEGGRYHVRLHLRRPPGLGWRGDTPEPGDEATAMQDPCPVGLRGIVPSLNTPFTADDAVDLASVRRLVDWTVEAGSVGMLILAVAGEG
jgi:hypothetical protein